MLSRLIFVAAICATVLVAPSVASIKRAHENYHTILQRRHQLGLSSKPQASGNVTQHVMVQPMDHYDRYNTETYNQTYWLNEQFLSTSRPTGFIFLGGEWEESSSTIEYGGNIMSSWASTFQGLMLNIQHRYYDNINPPSEDNQPRYLNSMQALADAARIVKHVNEQYASKLKQPIKWIVTSGSYGGIMAATFRQKFPELTVGAIAISAPVTATLDYDGFFEVDGRVLNASKPDCFKTVREAVKQLDQYLDDSKNGWPKINKDFQTNIQSEDDVATFAVGAVWDITEASLCSFDGATPYDQLVASGITGLNATYDANTVLGPYGNLWAEQICAEWSFFQTGSDFDTNPLQIATRHATSKIFMKACNDAFGITPERVAENIRWTNVLYGGKNFTTTNTFFSNGNADSWSAAGIIEGVPQLAGNQIYIIDQGTHCSDLYWPTSFDSKSLIAARAAEVDAIKQWLRG